MPSRVGAAVGGRVGGQGSRERSAATSYPIPKEQDGECCPRHRLWLWSATSCRAPQERFSLPVSLSTATTQGQLQLLAALRWDAAGEALPGRYAGPETVKFVLQKPWERSGS